MRQRAFALRVLGLAGVALLAGVVVLGSTTHSSRSARPADSPRPVQWYAAKAGPYAPPPARKRTACGQRLDATTLGVAHPVLPCGVKLFVALGERRILTQVIDRGRVPPGRAFDLTQALARRIGLKGTQPVRWSFAR